MFISPISYRVSNINVQKKPQNIAKTDRTNEVTFAGKNKANEKDLLQSEMFTEYNLQKVQEWAEQYEGFTTKETDSKIIVVKDKDGHIVRRITKDFNFPKENKVYDDIIQIYDEKGKCTKRYIRHSNGYAELAHGGYKNGGWNIYTVRQAGKEEWTEYIGRASRVVPDPIAAL